MRKWIIIVLGLIIAAIVSYNYIYQDHRTIENETTEFVMTSQEIKSQFSKEIKTAETNYLNKTIEVSGLVSEINAKDITLDDKVFCQFSETIEASIKNNSALKIKGRVIGYDDLLEQVKLDQCTINNN
ncbi:hypothetical protein [uncultured Winogradskyella sp.]|uniref:OB-fold protein n=1 Tax=uncultured Winogradskyella sp. TaxID=395353 RepID=UPI002608E0B1|nr:hypothetical protein [uncultured Winogradskyella sp.]|tara:strand:+ start:352 stop:735 length:384 start_codon:yes stop_codon:yes gene_type:complete